MASGTRKAGAQRVAGPWTKLSAAWLALVIGAAIWAKLAGQGPFAWFETWYAVTTGSFLGANVLFVILIVTLPAVIVLMGAIERAEKAARTPAARRRQMLWMVGSLFGLAGLFMIVAIVAGVMAMRSPDGSEAALPVAPEQIARGEAPTGRRIAITGTSDLRAQTSFVQPGKNSSTIYVYTGFRPGATRDDAEAAALNAAPVTIFTEGSYSGGAGDWQRPAQETAEGYLIEDGLPPYARIALARRGVRIAAPHYLLRNGEGGLAGDYFVPIALRIFFAFVFGFIGTTVLIVSIVKSGAGRRGADDGSGPEVS